MSKTNENKLVPKLRFREFQNSGGWILKSLGLFTNITIGEFVIKTKQNPNSPYPVYNGGRSYTGFYDEYNNEANRIVISARGANAGFANLVKQRYWAGNSCYSVSIIDQNALDLEFLFYYIKENQTRFTDNQQAANIPSVSKADVQKFIANFPLNLFEQQKIAACLSSLDEVITAESQKLDVLKGHKTGLLQILLPQEGEAVPKFRFKEFEESGDWVEKTLGEICKVTSGGTPSRTNNDYWNGEIPWISTTLIDFNIISAANEYITEAGLQNSSAKIFPKNTILMAMYGQGKTRGKVALLGIEAATNQACAAILLKDGYNTNFVFQNLAGRYDEIRKLSNQGGQENLSGGLIENITIRIPINPEEQQKIADTLSSVDELINVQSQKVGALKLHKKGLLQGLFPTLNNEE